jgi:hypothetical protein
MHSSDQEKKRVLYFHRMDAYAEGADPDKREMVVAPGDLLLNCRNGRGSLFLEFVQNPDREARTVVLAVPLLSSPMFKKTGPARPKPHEIFLYNYQIGWPRDKAARQKVIQIMRLRHFSDEHIDLFREQSTRRMRNRW